MIRSMTGYGRGEFRLDDAGYSIEARALNHRHLDIKLRCPERLSAVEGRIREAIKKRFSRGSFSISLSLTEPGEPALKLNIALARVYMEAAEELRRTLGIDGEPDALFLLRLKDIFTAGALGAADAEADWEAVSRALEAAFAQLEEWREREGAELEADLKARLSTLEGLINEVERRVPEVNEAYRKKLAERIESLVGDKVDESRIAVEAAVFAERADVSEEIARLRSHLKLFDDYLARVGECVGKRLDFLCQEMGREINTTGSKSGDVPITRTVIEMKGTLEKIREQVQNVE